MSSVGGFSMGFSTGGGYDVNDGVGGVPPDGPVIRSKGILATDICCYGCGDVLSAKVTITSCQCTFCDDCMERFMSNSDSCPSCGMKLISSQFAEVAVADYKDSPTFDKDNSIMDAILTTNSKDGSIDMHQMAANLMREYTKHEKRNQFIFKQLSNQESHTTSTSHSTTSQRIKDLEQKLLHEKTNNTKMKDQFTKENAILRGELAKKSRQLGEFARRSGHGSASVSSYHGGRGISSGSHLPTDASFMGSHHPEQFAGDGFSHGNAQSPSKSTPSPSHGSSYQDFLRRKKLQEQAETAALNGGHRPIVGGGNATAIASAQRYGTPLPTNPRISSHRTSNQAPVVHADRQNCRPGSYPRHNVPASFAPPQRSSFLPF